MFVEIAFLVASEQFRIDVKAGLDGIAASSLLWSWLQGQDALADYGLSEDPAIGVFSCFRLRPSGSSSSRIPSPHSSVAMAKKWVKWGQKTDC